MTREEMMEHCNAYGYSDEEVGAFIDGFKHGRADAFKDCILDSKEYCWQECCATEHCGECSRLDNGQIDYFDNTFCYPHGLSYADMPTTL